MSYINLKLFRNRNEMKKISDREYFDRIYKQDGDYTERMKMLDISFDLEPNMTRANRYQFVNGLIVSSTILSRLDSNSYYSVTDMSLVDTISYELTKMELDMNLDDNQKDYFEYGIFTGIMLRNNENTKQQEKVFKKN